MMRVSLIVLKQPALFWRAIRAGHLRLPALAALLAFVLPASAAYGATMAGWRSPLLALYVAIKLPLVFLITVATVSMFNAMAANALGCRIAWRQTLLLAAGAMTTACWILLAFIPIALFFMHAGVPRTGDEATLHYAHNLILMIHIVALAAAGTAGNAVLLRGLIHLAPSRARAAAVFAIWIAAYAFVGGQASWILRPFVGSPFFPVAFCRADALDRNFYEFVWGEVMPYVIQGGTTR